ncbi:MAG: cupin domain-containing protein [Microbacteriaceae bacterium]
MSETTSNKAATSAGDPSTVFIAANDFPRGDFSPKPTTTTDGQLERAVTVWSSGGHETGVWEATPGSFTAVRDGYTEICYIMSGSVTVQADGEAPQKLSPGDILVMPSGWRGTWHVHEPVVKHYTIITD